jgi:hypothetical protein
MIRNKIIIIAIGFIIILFGTIASLIYQVTILKESNDRIAGNYLALSTDLKVLKLDNERTLYRIGEEVLTNRELSNSRDAEVLNLLSTIKELNIKQKNLIQLLKLESNSTHDTTVVVKVDTIPGTTIVRELDSLTIGKLHIKRIKLSTDNIAKYKVVYNPTLTIIVHEEKIGKWKLRNLFHKREKETLVDVISDDELLKFTKLRAIKVKH